MAARLGAGFNPEQMHAERVNGYDPFAVIDAVSRKEGAAAREARDRPCLMSSPTASQRALSASDSSTYRIRGGARGSGRQADPIRALQGPSSSSAVWRPRERVRRRLTRPIIQPHDRRSCRLAINDETLSPQDGPREGSRRDRVASCISNGHEETMASMGPARPEVLMPEGGRTRA